MDSGGEMGEAPKYSPSRPKNRLSCTTTPGPSRQRTCRMASASHRRITPTGSGVPTPGICPSADGGGDPLAAPGRFPPVGDFPLEQWQDGILPLALDQVMKIDGQRPDS
ncbi:hypothetical protein NHX12_002966 [Muraenolepis orangiensis]|uniref:Uncharacterized protein n=1 Tax=Muraenolepis orangiensis TaxID=630683 RepID=A0A9Q0IGS5_9TELE|nr:hypothetical protein NHX12_002966 [Muraenolepis orangiensis]